MKEKLVLDRNNLPTRIPIGQTVLYTFLMYYFQAPEWLWGIYVTIMLILWITIIYLIFREQPVSFSQMIEKQESVPLNKPNRYDIN